MGHAYTSKTKVSFTCEKCGEKKTFKSKRMYTTASRLHAKQCHGSSRVNITNFTITNTKVNYRI
jgi:predicted RNA-binding Zn-ribbon protein involved in translation (DUF1610 family)